MRRFSLGLLCVLALGAGRQTVLGQTAARPVHPSSTASQQAASSSVVRKLPLSFEPNRGQADSRVKYLSRGNRYTVFLTGDAAVLAFKGPEARSRKLEATSRKSEARDAITASPQSIANRKSQIANDSVLEMRLPGANPNAPVSGINQLPGNSNYLIGSDPARWRTNIPNYGRVQYRDVYPGIDLAYYGNEGKLEYDFVVAPGADPGRIRLALGSPFAVRDSLRLASDGDLVMRLPGGEVRFHKPVVYQPDPVAPVSSPAAAMRMATQQPPSDGDSSLFTRHLSLVEGRYKLTHRNQIEFVVGRYDKSRPLVIDPTLSYSTYLGGSQGDAGYGIAVDSTGNTYIAGQTCSTNFPVQAPEQAANAGQCDAFVTKLNPTGTALLYSTYLGGSGGDQANGIAIDSSGNAYVTGITNSTNFPTTAGSFQTAYGGGDTDVFVTKLNSSGSALVYSTYLGGSDADSGNAIALDASGDAFVTGETYSNPFPTTVGALQTTYGGRGDAFVTELNPAGAALVYSTYLGGELQDAGNGIAVDNVGSTFVTGSTYSQLFPVAHAIQENCGGFNIAAVPPCPAVRDAFISKLSAGGSSLVYSTYLGGSQDDVGAGIALDSLGAAYVAGFTTSTDFPVRPDALQTSLAGTQNAFVTKVDPLGGAPFEYSTYLGGNGVDAAAAIAVDLNGLAYVTGGTTSTNFPTVSAIQNSLSGPLNYPGDAFVSKVDADGSGLIYSSFLGGGDHDVGNAIAVDSSLAVYVAGSTSSIDFPITTGSVQTTYAGAGDAFATKLNALTAAIAELSPRSLSFGNQALGIPSAPQTVTVNNPGDAPLLVSTIVESGDIYQPPPINGVFPPTIDLKDWDITADNCTGVSVAVGLSCTFTVSFDPNTATPPNGLGVGARTGTITLSDNATSPTQVIQLAGTGVSPPAVLLLPLSLSFSNTLSGTTSAAQTVTLSNSGGFLLAISSISASSSFAETNTCGSSLGPAGTCTVTVTFSPTTSGTITGALTINDDASNTPQAVSLTGIGTAPVASFSPSAATGLTFASQPVNSSSSPQGVTLTNTGTATLNITGVTLSGTNSADFSLTQTCGSSLATGAGCAINVTFSPKAAGARVASVNVADNAQASPQMIPLNGTAILAPSVSLSATSLTFAAQNEGTASPAQTITLTNTGSAPLTVTNTAATGGFAQTNNCPASLAAAAKCVITVTFTPAATGNVYGSVTITDNATGSPQTILLAGVGNSAPVVKLSTATLTFAGQSLGTASAAQSVTVTNSGSAALTITSVAASGDFAETNSCPASMAPAGTCTINVTFTPTATGTRTGSLTIKDNATGSPQTVTLGGAGSDFSLGVSPASNTVLAGTAASYTLTLTPQNGFSAKVTFTCSTPTPSSSCSVSPATVTPDGTNPATATITVSTAMRGLAPPGRGPRPIWPRLGAPGAMQWLIWLFVFGAILLAAAARAQRSRVWVALAAVMLLSAGLIACGGGSGVSDPTGTPGGTYTVSISAASGAVSHSASATLVVQ